MYSYSLLQWLINYLCSGGDTHIKPFQLFARRLKEAERSVAAHCSRLAGVRLEHDRDHGIWYSTADENERSHTPIKAKQKGDQLRVADGMRESTACCSLF
mmetsp:Transcript_26918/g.81509  ORF Transcript_26918/g.81509 Transcript_26918/m.81509 type:complete len:100 (+) Transcript_26918:90-389(+)|eukprot:scaffold329093_cov54-Tisochrysis_lutea.AAC.2